MTHARKKQLFLLKHPAGCAGRASSPPGSRRMDRTGAECGEQRDGDATEAPSCPSGFVGTSKSKTLHEVRKTYPLRRRLLPSVNKKTCKVLLTRLEDVAGSLSKQSQSCKTKDLPSWMGLGPALFSEQVQPVGAGKSDSSGEKCTATYPGTEQEPEPAPSEPRKRRLASLNAEAVNNLLFERDEGLLSSRRFRRDSVKASGDCAGKSLQCKAGDSWPALEKPAVKAGKGKHRHEPGQKCSSCDHALDEVFDDGTKREDGAISHHPTPKRLASLNAVAFLKLTHEKDQPLKPRSKSDGEGKSENHCSKSTLKWAKANRKNCVKSKKELASLKLEGQRGWPGHALAARGKGEQRDSSRLYGTAEPVPYESLSSSYASTEGFYHRLPLLMGGQASMKPEYGRPGEKSPTPKQEFHQPSFPVQQFPPLPVPGNHTDCGCLYEASDLTPLNGFYVCCGQSGYSGYSHCSIYPKEELSQSATCEGLLVSPSSLPSGAHFQPLHWCNSPYCCGEGTALNTYSLCGVMHVPEGRISSVHAGRSSYPFKMPFAAEGCKSLDQLNLTIPVAGHPASPAHPLSGCPVPSVPPAAEPVPHLQTPNSDPQTMARECPQSSKPPSGSKSGLRNTPGCLHASDSKAVGGHSHPKQQRISRRRATNGWIPVGAACEKAVYVVNEPEPAVRKSYQAVERDGEIIRVRDTVLLKSGPRKKSMPYVAKISALWEDPKTGELMMSLLWYYRPEHTQGGRNPSMHQNEIFASRHQDENSVACIEEKCYVLTFAEYCRPPEVTDPARRSAAAARRGTAEDSSESREEEPASDGQDMEGWFSRGSQSNRATVRPKLNLTKQPLPWNEQYKGKANLHVFEDWCGGAVRHLRKNLHFPLFPHTRTTVKKLAVSPKWKNYGLRIFGYIHPFKDGDFQFSVASDDNSELWLSSDDSPASSRLVAFVGRLGTEWTAPGEFTKFSSQVSKPLRLMSSRRYYFELLHKQDDRGSDHVEVGWRVFLPSLKFEVIDSSYISLYTDESSLKMNHVEHIPQTLASHSGSYLWEAQQDEHGADMLKSDPRDTFFLTPAIEASRVENVLVPCAYSPTYVVKDFPIARYQGLQFVYLSFVYPNDFTRLTHMETENKCFYRESPLYLEKFGFYKYMKMDEEEEDPRQRPFLFLNADNFLEDEEEEEEGADSPEPTDPPPKAKEKNFMLVPRAEGKEMPPVTRDYGHDLDYYSFGRRQGPARAEAIPGTPGQVGRGSTSHQPSTSPTPGLRALHGEEDEGPALEQVHGRKLNWLPQDPSEGEEDDLGLLASSKHAGAMSLQPHRTVPIFSGKARTPGPSRAAAPREDRKAQKTQEKVYVTRLQPGKRRAPAREPAFPGLFLYPKPLKKVHLHSRTPQKHPIASGKLRAVPGRRSPWLLSSISRERGPGRQKNTRAGGRRWELRPGTERRVLPGLLALGTEGLFSRETQEDTTPAPGRAAATAGYNSSEATLVTSLLKVSETTASQQEGKGQEEEEEEEEVSDYSYEAGELQQSWLEDSINWQRTFSVSAMDFELLRSDWNDLRCNVSGNLQLSESEVVDVVAQYMEKLNEKNGGIYTLLRIINVEKRRDTARGNRYLLELELAERGQRTVRLSEYVYVLLHQDKQDDSAEANPEGLALGATEPPPSTWSILYGKPVLCRPLRLSWKQDVMVHFVVPVKNQARWVQQFISDMAHLYGATKDPNFNVILVDFDSEDMDVEKALQDAHLPRYQYLRRTGNFERSAGLQAGVDTVEDGHSIVFLCDLHIHFPSNILDSIRKHCVEGKLAYAPIVMRLSCGSSPREPNGYWEVNGFGLFGIYKSDFDRVGGMNTEEFRDRWGGEDWELLDRVLQSGLEVERLRLRNFYHYHHSKRGMWNARSKKPPKD